MDGSFPAVSNAMGLDVQDEVFVSFSRGSFAGEQHPLNLGRPSKQKIKMSKLYMFF